MLNEEFSNSDLGLEDREESTASEVNASTSNAVDQNSQRSAEIDEKDINNVLLSQVGTVQCSRHMNYSVNRKSHM